jgi:hypothetical protein
MLSIGRRRFAEVKGLVATPPDFAFEKLEKVGKSWKKLEKVGKSWKKLEKVGKSWKKFEKV